MATVSLRTCTVAIALGVALMAPTPATAQPAPTEATHPAPVAKRGNWETTGPQMGVKLRYRWNTGKLQKRWDFRFKRRSAATKGKRQIRVRWQHTKGNKQPKAGHWKKRTRRIAPGGHRRIKFRASRCGPKVGLWVDVQVRRNRAHKPQKWRKWEYLVAIYSGRKCR